MSDEAAGSRDGDVRLTVRVPLALAGRIEDLARYCGLGRSAFIRTALTLTEAGMTLTWLDDLELKGPLDLAGEALRTKASRRHEEAEAELRPKPLNP